MLLYEYRIVHMYFIPDSLQYLYDNPYLFVSHSSTLYDLLYLYNKYFVVYDVEFILLTFLNYFFILLIYP